MSSELWQRLRVARKHAGLTQQQVADLFGIERAAVSQWESEKPGKQRTKPDLSRLQAIAEATGAPLLWLIDDTSDINENWMGRISEQDEPNQSGEVSESQQVARFETADSYVRFPLLEGFAGMGRGEFVGDYPEVVQSLQVSREWVERKLPGVPPEAIRVITGRGDSMKGQYNDGDLIFLDTRIKAFDQDSAYCFRWEGRVLVKRLQFVGRGTLRILSKNPDYPAIDAPLDDIEIGGRALAAWTLKEF